LLINKIFGIARERTQWRRENGKYTNERENAYENHNGWKRTQREREAYESCGREKKKERERERAIVAIKREKEKVIATEKKGERVHSDKHIPYFIKN